MKTDRSKTIQMPEFFHEVFGESQTVMSLAVIFIFALLGSGLVLWQTADEWAALATWKRVVLILLYLDITGGVLANLSYGTNVHYSQSAKRRLIFIAVHIQPLLLALVFGQVWLACATVWAYTIVTALLVNGLAGQEMQRLAGGFFMFAGVIGILLFASVPLSVQVLLILFLIKVVYSFAVDHYAKP